MSYEAEITRENPGCIVFLIDQSGSMEDRIADKKGGRTKAQGVADAINDLLNDLVIKCTGPAGVSDYFDIGVIGYGEKVGSVFSGGLVNRDLVPLSEVARYRSDREAIFPFGFGPVAEGDTPMCAALNHAHEVLAGWVIRHPASYPPIVINITDGESTDGNPTEPASRLASLSTNDGYVLIFNCHISARKEKPVLFPHDAKAVPAYGPRLFHMSSILPPKFRETARNLGFDVVEDTRGFAFNAELTDMVKFLDLGKHALIAQVSSMDSSLDIAYQQYIAHMQLVKDKNMSREDEIRLIAFYIWEAENRPDKHAMDDWLEAEKIWERAHQTYPVAAPVDTNQALPV
jgi:hypothetical protein